jgi:hypothetical protein
MTEPTAHATDTAAGSDPVPAAAWARRCRSAQVPESGPAGTHRLAGTAAVSEPVMIEGVSTRAEFEVEASDVAAFAHRLWPGVAT